MTMTLNRNTEIRKIKKETLQPVIDILSENERWITLMRNIPVVPHDLTSARRYNEEDQVFILEGEAEHEGRKKFAEILFEEWGSTGELGCRPTLGSLKTILIQAKLYQAANEVSHLLNEPIIEPDFYNSSGPSGPPVPVIGDINSETIEISVSDNSPYLRQPPASASNPVANSSLVNFMHKDIITITNDFSHYMCSDGFGDVFKGYDNRFGFLAIKMTKTQEFRNSLVQPDYKKAFDTEVGTLSMLRHKNIVPLVGVSEDGPLCIVLQYIDGGSLTNKIAEQVLKEDEIIKIIIGIADGLKYIHHSVKPCSPAGRKFYFIHGDVKTDNILLTRDLVPKLCNFGLSKHVTLSGTHTIRVNGTYAYLAPECLRGVVTLQSDVYSFGIVLLQLLTGLKPIIETPEGRFDISSYIKKHNVNGNFSNLLDTSVTWTKAQKILEITKQCLLYDRYERLSMAEICERLPCLNN